MLNLIKIEIYKSVRSKYFIIALLIAFIVQLFSFFENYEFVKHATEFAYSVKETVSPDWRGANDGKNMYVLWLSHEGCSMGFTLATYMLPLLAVFPYGWSLFSEISKGYQNQMLCRSGKVKYFIAKYIAVFLSGVAVIAFMLISNLMLCALIGEWGPPRCYTQSTAVRHGVIASTLFFTKPLIAALIWTGIASLWAGALAGMSMLFGQVLKRSIFVLAAPLLITVLLDNICIILPSAFATEFSFSVNFFLCTATEHQWIIWTELVLLVAAGLGGGLVCYLNREAL